MNEDLLIGLPTGRRYYTTHGVAACCVNTNPAAGEWQKKIDRLFVGWRLGLLRRPSQPHTVSARSRESGGWSRLGPADSKRRAFVAEEKKSW